MLTFIVPIKSKTIANSWTLVSKLAQRTLKSICNQTSPNFRVIVVCNEKPDIQFEHPYIHYIEIDFSGSNFKDTESEQLEGYAYAGSLEIINKNADKAQKILVGIDYARQFQTTHIMVVDADDCVSRHLAKFVDQNQNSDGWLLKKGYMYKEGSRIIYLNRKNFNHISGTSVIFKPALVSLFFEKPDFYKTIINDNQLNPLPFIGVLYSMGNGENILANSVVISQMKNTVLKVGLSAIFERIVKYRVFLLTKSIIADFGLYNVNH